MPELKRSDMEGFVKRLILNLKYDSKLAERNNGEKEENRER